LTVALKQSDGSTNPTTDSILKSQISFRSTTLTSGAKTVVDFTAALSIVIPSTATLGYVNGADAKVFIYAYYDGTNKGLAVSSRKVDESQLYSLVEIDTSADGNSLYADAARSNAAVRFIGEASVNAITTAGTWTTPTYVAVSANSHIKKGLLRTIYYNTAGTPTYTKNPYADFIEVEVIGGGGGSGGVDGEASGQAMTGGGGSGGYSRKTILNSAVGATETVTVGALGAAGASGNNAGSSGGTSSFGSHCSATGGSGGAGMQSTTGSGGGTGGNAGVGSGGDLNLYGNDGANGRTCGGVSTNAFYGGIAPMWGSGHDRNGSASTSGYGCGGAGTAGTTSNSAGQDGNTGIVIVREYKN
jgi:hypothetical protein